VAIALALVAALSLAAWLVSTGITNPAFTGLTNGAIQPPPAPAAYDIFMKISGIPGESTDGGHEDWIEVLSFSQGMGRPSTFMGGVEYSRAVILKELDKSSPKLYEALNTGLQIASLEIEMVNPDNRTASMKIILENVIVSSIETGLSIFKDWGSASPIIYKQVDSSSPQITKSSPMLSKPLAFGHDARYMEEVSFTYQKIHWNYTYSGANGQNSSVVSGWDLLQNKVD